MKDFIYPSLARGLMRGTLDLTGKLKVMLVSSKYEPSSKHKVRDDITHEVKGVGYLAGGTALSNNKLVDKGDQTVLTADPAVWARATVTARGAVVYASSGGGSKYDELICYCHFDADTSSTNGPFTITWDEGGIVVLGAASTSTGT